VPLIDLDSVQLYQSPDKADLAGQRPSMASIDDVLVVCGERNVPTISELDQPFSEILNCVTNNLLRARKNYCHVTWLQDLGKVT